MAKRYLLVLGMLGLFSCGREAATLRKIEGRWKAVSKTEQGVELADTGNLFLVYRFEPCPQGHTCPVHIGLTENGETHEFDQEPYRISANGKTVYFSNHPWDIVLLDAERLHLQNEADSLLLKFVKL